VRHSSCLPDLKLTCPAHRGIFIEICERHGVRNPLAQEMVRRHFVGEMTRKHIGLSLHCYAEQACPGCMLQLYGPDAWEWCLAALKAICNHQPVPVPVYRPWTAKARLRLRVPSVLFRHL